MARVEGGAVIIDTDWPGLKDQIDSRNINFKYEEDSTAYQIFAIDGQYFYQTVIYKSGQAPQNQATYDTWRSEFEATYKNRTTDFTSTQPFYLTTVDGYSVVLKNGAAPTSNDGYGIGLIGIDGSNYRMMRTDSSGRPVMVGPGTAGSPSGGIITVQGDAAGTPIPISGNITASNASVAANDGTIPGFSNLIGGSDGTNLRPLRVFDADTGGGQQWVLGVGLRKSAGGGSVDFGTSSDPIRIDPTGTTTQPVSGTVTANQGGAWTVAATQSGTWTVQPGNTPNTTPWLTTISQGGNDAIVTASNALKIDGSAVTQPVSGTITANAGTGNFTVVQSTAANLRAQLASESSTGAAIPSTALMIGGSDGSLLRSIFVDSSGRPFVVGAAANGAAVAGNPVLIAGSDGTNARSIRTATDGTIRVDPTGTTTQPVSGTVAATQSGTWTVQQGTPPWSVSQSGTWTVQPGNTANTTPWLTTISQGGNSATVTASNALKVDGSAVTQPVSGTITANQGGAPWSSNITQFGGVAISTGTGASGTGIPRVTVANDSNILATQSGTWTVQQGTPPWQIHGPAAAGAAVSGNPVLIGGSDGTNARFAKVDANGTQFSALLDPETLNSAFVTPLRSIEVSNRNTIVSDSLANGIDPGTWLTTAANGGTATVPSNSGNASLETSANANGSVQIVSVLNARFQSGYSYIFQSAVKCGDTGVTNNTRRWGAFTVSSATPGVPQNGYYFELNGTTLNAVSVKAGVATAVASTSWSRGSYTADVTNFHRYEIVYQGNFAAFLIDGSVKHVLSGAGVSSARTAVLDFNVCYQNVNTASAATNQTMQIRGSSLNKVGHADMLSAPLTASWTSSTALNTALQLPVVEFTAASLSFVPSGTITGGVITFEVSDDFGTTWYPVSGTRSDGTAYEGTYTLTGATRLWQFNLTGYTNFRARLSTVIAGSGTATLRVTGSSSPTEAVPIKLNASTGTTTSVAASASNVTLLAANITRIGATIYNDSTVANLFLKLGATASATSFTVRLVPNAYFEVPFGYTGIIDGIWSVATGNARITELT